MAWSNRSGLCVYANGQFHDFSGGAREHGYSAFQLIEHLYPNEDAVAWARDWLARHPGNGSFTACESEPVDDFVEVEAMAFIERLYNGAAPIDGTPGYVYSPRRAACRFAPRIKPSCAGSPTIEATRARSSLPSRTTKASSSNCYVTYVTVDGRKSPYGGYRSIHDPRCKEARPLSPWVASAECGGDGRARRRAWRRARPGRNTSSFLAARQSRQGSSSAIVRSVVIARDADLLGSPADQALWCGVVRRLGQTSKSPLLRARMTSRRRKLRRSRISMTSGVTTLNLCPSARRREPRARPIGGGGRQRYPR